MHVKYVLCLFWYCKLLFCYIICLNCAFFIKKIVNYSKICQLPNFVYGLIFVKVFHYDRNYLSLIETVDLFSNFLLLYEIQTTRRSRTCIGTRKKLTNFGEIKRKSKFLIPTTFNRRMCVGICFELVLYFSLII